MRQKTQELIEVLSEEISKSGTATTQQLKQTAKSKGFKGGYVIPICNKYFRRLRHGVWCLKSTPVLFDPTPYQRPKKRCRLTEHDRKRLVQAALLDGEVIQFNERRFKEIALREGVERLPKNINLALRREIQKAYTELLDTITSPNSSSSSSEDIPKPTQVSSPPSPYFKISTLIERRRGIEREIEEELQKLIPRRSLKNLCCEVQLPLGKA